jgi:hypothetical protein
MPIEKSMFRRGIDSYVASLKVKTNVKSALDEYIESYEDELFDFLGALLRQYGLEDQFRTFIDSQNKTLSGQHHQVLIAILIGLAMSVVGGVISSGSQPVMEALTQDALQNSPNKLPEPGALIRYLKIFPNQRPNVLAKMAKQGYSQEVTDLLVAASASFLEPNTMLAALHRGLTTDKQYEDYMKIFGYSGYDTNLLRDLSQQIPPIQDLISMAVREAFTDTAAKKFELDANFPDSILPFTKAQGLSDEWVHRYWRAHWQLPSIGQALEMYQRLRPGVSNVPFTFDDLQEYLVTADVPRFFRERLTQIAYNPVTRVDIRRLYRMGIYSETQVLGAYRNGGYSPEDAEALTKFTVLDAVDEDSGVTRSTILSAFRKGYIDYPDAKKRLTDSGHSDKVATFYLDIELHNRAEKLKDASIDWIVTQFVEGLIDETTMNFRLDQLGITASEKQTIVFTAKDKRQNKITLPSKSDVEDWYEKRLINDGEYVSYLVRRGYDLLDARRFLQAVNADIAERAKKEMERASKEYQRQVENATEQAYSRNAALIDLDIAQLNLSIANIKLAVSQTEDANTVDELTGRIAAIDVQIKQKLVDKARLRV